MRILVVGGGGREHSLVWRLLASGHEVLAAPGNAGIATIAPCHKVPVEDVAGQVMLAQDHKVDLVVVGPEAPLTLGLADALRAKGIAVLGPSAQAARLEGSKAFTKSLCTARGIPTARSETFSEAAAALAYVRRHGAPIVVKADGLAAGKGVVVAESLAEAEEAVARLLDPALGGRVVIEDKLLGEEVSFFALCDGTRALSLGAAQDHKRAFDGDLGPNTGGMGAYSPAPIFTPALEARVIAEIIQPTLAGMAAMGHPFTGILFAGLMISPQGDPFLIEFNVRLGDPEAEVLMLRLEGDLGALFLAAALGRLPDVAPSLTSESALCVVMAAQGYPGMPKTGGTITLPESLAEDVQIFHAGTARADDGRLIAQGGRVLAVSARGANLRVARDLAYATIQDIVWEDGFCRADIGHRALNPKP